MTVHTLSTVNLADSTKYRATVGGSSIRTNRERQLTPYRGADGSRLTKSFISSIDIETLVWSRGATFQAALDNYNAIVAALTAARAYQMAGTGTVVLYSEQFGNESAARTYTVLDGDYDMDQRELTGVNMIGGRLRLICTP